MNRRGDTWAVLLALPALLAAAYLILSRTSEKAEFGPHHTTYSALPTGYKAAYLLLQQRGVSVFRYQAGTQHWPDDARVMISANPVKGAFSTQIWGPDEVKDALRWLDKGGTLILLSDEDNALTKKFFLRPNDIGPKSATLAPRQPAPFLDGVKGVLFPNQWRFEKTPDTAIPLFSDKNAAFLVFRRGKGTLFAAPTPALIENHHLDDADNARFFAQLVESRQFDASGKKGKVYFDELHQGFQKEPSFWEVIGAPGRFALLQIALVSILLCYTVGRRFGVPRPAPPPSRVSSEYVASLADLYRRAGARDAALEGVYLSFWRDLCRAAGLPLDAPTADAANRAAALMDGKADDLRKRLLSVLERSEDAISRGGNKLNDGELLRLTREMDGIRKELGLSGND